MFWDSVTSEEEENFIKKAAEIILKYEMELPAILFLGTFKPLVSLGGQLGRFFIGPLLPFMGEREDKFIQVFEKRENVEKLIDLLEQKKKEEKELRKADREAKGEAGKRGWRRYLPF